MLWDLHVSELLEMGEGSTADMTSIVNHCAQSISLDYGFATFNDAIYCMNINKCNAGILSRIIVDNITL